MKVAVGLRRVAAGKRTSGRRAAQIAEIRQNGSHITMKNRVTGKTVIVPYHSKAMKKGLEQAILKQAGLK